jgi:hypothetical protein
MIFYDLNTVIQQGKRLCRELPNNDTGFIYEYKVIERYNQEIKYIKPKKLYYWDKKTGFWNKYNE